jgi:hypothetical protein
MKRAFLTGLAILAAGLPLGAAPAPKSDLQPPQRRETSVATAERLAVRPAVPPLPADFPNPFNPVGFDQPDPGAVKTPAPGGAVAQVPVQTGDREILETLAARLTPSGTLILGGKPLLIIERNRFEVGTRFIVTYNGEDFELELVAIDRTTFTLRFRGEELTRPIKPVK